MKKTLTINLNGIVFNIEEDAYEILKKYLDSIGDHFATSEGTEIVADIEARASEQFSKKINETKQVITLFDAQELIKIMGTVQDIVGEEKTGSGDSNKSSPEQQEIKNAKSPKKLYRNPDDAVICGVCSGLAAFLGIDPVIVRVIFIAFTLFGGYGILLYIILCLIIPEAKTSAQKIEMQGEPVNLSSIKEVVQEKMESSKNLKTENSIKRIAAVFGRSVKTFALALSAIIGLVLIIAGSLGIAFAIFSFVNLIVNPGSFHTDFPVQDLLAGTGVFPFLTLALTIIIPLIFLIQLGSFFINRRSAASFMSGMPLLMIWIISLAITGVYMVKLAPAYNEKMQAVENAALVSQTYNLKDFNAIDVQGWQNIHIVKGDNYKIEVTGSEKNINETSVTVSGQTLQIRENSNICIFCFKASQKNNFFVTMPALTSYKASGMIKSDIGEFGGAELNLDLNGASITTANVLAQNLAIKADSLSNATLTGYSDSMTMRLNGVSSVNATKLQTKNVNISIDGPSKAEIWATNTLNVTGDGPSSIYYIGDPIITKQMSGLSSLHKIE